MGYCFALTSFLVLLIGGLSYYLGLFDRPAFVFHDSIVGSQRTANTEEQEIFAIMAFTRSPDFGSHIGRMLEDTKALLDENPTAKEAMKSAATIYGVPEDVDSLGVGLYFDNPSTVPDPRWGVGWAVSATSFDDIESIRTAVDAFYEGSEEIRRVRLGLHGPGLKARIPWRTMLTPVIAPMIHWSRVHTHLSEAGYDTTSNDPDDNSYIFSEIYVTSQDDKTHHFIDYIALLGDTTNVWEDSFPSDRQKKQESSSLVDEDENLAYEAGASEDSAGNIPEL